MGYMWQVDERKVVVLTRGDLTDMREESDYGRNER